MKIKNLVVFISHLFKINSTKKKIISLIIYIIFLYIISIKEFLKQEKEIQLEINFGLKSMSNPVQKIIYIYFFLLTV